jgi:hypothetical protein
MNTTHRSGSERPAIPAFVLPLCVFLAIAVTLFAYEHRAHLLGWLPFLFLLACPVMHLFMHGRHGNHGEEQQSHSNNSSSAEREEGH